MAMTKNFGERPKYRLHEYTTLDGSPRPIRLLHLRSDTANGPSWTLEQYDLDHAPKYRALSYAWGSETSDHTICINGKLLTIGQNLFDFLTTVSTEIIGPYLWADQICINQQSLGERNQQVSMMDQIYKSAETVIIWLGPASALTNDFSLIAEWLRNQDDTSVLVERGIIKIAESQPQYSDEVLQTDRPRPMNGGNLRLTSKGHQVLDDLFGRSYWSRLWPVQEVLHAQDIVLAMGDLLLDWAALDHLLRTMSGPYRERATKKRPSSLNLRERRIFYARQQHAQDDSYSKLMQDFMSNECTDPRDKLYGLLSLVDDASKPQVDYSKPIEQVYLDAIELFFRERTSLPRGQRLRLQNRRDLMHHFEQSVRLGSMMLSQRPWPIDSLSLELGRNMSYAANAADVKVMQRIWPAEMEEIKDSVLNMYPKNYVAFSSVLDPEVDDAEYKRSQLVMLNILGNFALNDSGDFFAAMLD